MKLDTKVLTVITASALILFLAVGFIAYASESSFRSYGASTAIAVSATSSYGKWIFVVGTIYPAWATSAQVTINVNNPRGVQVLSATATQNPNTGTSSANFSAGISNWISGTYTATVTWANSTTSNTGSALFTYGAITVAISNTTKSSTSIGKSTTIFVNHTTTITSATTISSVTTAPGQLTTVTSTVNHKASTVSYTATTTLVRLNAIGITLAAIGVAIAIAAGGVSLVALLKRY
ncbi:MAG: hypothetical protein ACYCPW_05895 [Nitrososphaerales archaeon]